MNNSFGFKKIEMEVIPHGSQRYDTVGDYFEDQGVIKFRVSDLGDWRYNFSVLLHEFVEWALTTHNGVSEKDVMSFDLSVPESDDPGFEADCPYQEEHVYADCMERLIAPRLGLKYGEVDESCRRLCDGI